MRGAQSRTIAGQFVQMGSTCEWLQPADLTACRTPASRRPSRQLRADPYQVHVSPLHRRSVENEWSARPGSRALYAETVPAAAAHKSAYHENEAEFDFD